MFEVIHTERQMKNVCVLYICKVNVFYNEKRLVWVLNNTILLLSWGYLGSKTSGSSV